MVHPAGIEPATLSLEVRSSFLTPKKFNAFGVQNEADGDQPTALHAPPAHYRFTLTDPKASLTGGHRETMSQRAFEPTGS